MKQINALIKSSVAAIAFVVVSPSIAQAGTFTFQAGLRDNFSSANGPELSNPSDGLKILMDNGYNQDNRWGSRDYTADFDGNKVNQIFGHTFNLAEYYEQGLFKGKIKSAQLEIHLKALNSSLTNTDQISLLFVDDAGNRIENDMGIPIRWGRAISDVPSKSVDGLLDTWETGMTHTFTFDLANLPLASNQDPSIFSGDLMATLNEQRFLDIYVQDDTAIDYVELRVDVPEPGSVLGLIGFTALGSLLRISKRKKVSS